MLYAIALTTAFSERKYCPRFVGNKLKSKRDAYATTPAVFPTSPRGARTRFYTKPSSLKLYCAYYSLAGIESFCVANTAGALGSLINFNISHAPRRGRGKPELLRRLAHGSCVIFPYKANSAQTALCIRIQRGACGSVSAFFNVDQ